MNNQNKRMNEEIKGILGMKINNNVERENIVKR